MGEDKGADMTVNEIREMLRCILVGSKEAFGKEIDCCECKYKEPCDRINENLKDIKEECNV